MRKMKTIIINVLISVLLFASCVPVNESKNSEETKETAAYSDTDIEALAEYESESLPDNEKEPKHDSKFWNGYESELESEPQSESDIEEQGLPMESVEGRGDMFFDKSEMPYVEIIEKHKRAIAEGWDAWYYSESEMSPLFCSCKTEILEEKKQWQKCHCSHM